MREGSSSRSRSRSRPRISSASSTVDKDERSRRRCKCHGLESKCPGKHCLGVGTVVAEHYELVLVLLLPPLIFS